MRPVGIVGLGVVGGTVARGFMEADVPVRRYDPYVGPSRPDDLGPSGVVFVCVPTPAGEDGSYDLRALWSALFTVEPHLRLGTLLAVKSTVPPGTSDRLAEAFPRLEVASVPEFLVADRPMETFTRPPRVVIGCRSVAAGSHLTRVMRTVAPRAPVVLVSPIEAELIKLCSNAMLASKVAVANELFEVADRFGVAWSRLQPAIGLDPRIGPSHLTVTEERGFGGACLPKDLDGLIAAAKGAGYRPSVLAEISGSNRRFRQGGSRDGRARPSLDEVRDGSPGAVVAIGETAPEPMERAFDAPVTRPAERTE